VLTVKPQTIDLQQLKNYIRMKKIVFLLMLLCSTLFFTGTHAQVLRVSTSPATISSQIPGYLQITAINTKTIAYTPSVPAASITPIDEDSTFEIDKVYEYADVIAANITMANGNITSTTVGKVWTLRVNIPNALNIGLLFNQFNLSATAEMYVFDEARTVLDSCIKKADFTTSTASIGLMPITGNSIIIYIVELNNFGTFQSAVGSQNIEAGYQPMPGEDDIESGSWDEGSLQMMRVNVNCDPLVQCQQTKMPYARAVALFATNGSQGTGTLINNEANNGRAYFLTAFHIIDKNKNNILDASEIAALASAKFQFQFWRTHCNGSVNKQGIEFTGATIRASSKNTDVVLLELINQPGIGDMVNYAGYNRQSSPPADYNGFVIHHPDGKDMRITSVKKVKHWFWNSNFWTAHYSSGTVAKGSSGSALMNENGQIIGQLRSGWSSCSFTDFGDRYGELSHSWNGANLQTWLSPTQNLQATNLLNLTDIPINGPDIMGCNAPPTQYSTTPNLLDVTYTWSVSTGFQIISGQGTANVVISGLPGNQYAGSGTLTLTLNSPTKGRIRTYTVSKNFTVSTNNISGVYNSQTSLTTPLITEGKAIPKVLVPPTENPTCAAFQTKMTIPPTSTVTWSGSADPGVIWYQSGNDVVCFFSAVNQTASMYIYITNACGSFHASYFFRCVTMNSCGIQPLSTNAQISQIVLSPNPTNNTLQITLSENEINKKIKSQSSITEVRIIDKLGSLVLTQKYPVGNNRVNVNISSLKMDVYTIAIYNGKTWATEKFIKN
jgi:hypothetical protein